MDFIVDLLRYSYIGMYIALVSVPLVGHPPSKGEAPKSPTGLGEPFGVYGGIEL